MTPPARPTCGSTSSTSTGSVTPPRTASLPGPPTSSASSSSSASCTAATACSAAAACPSTCSAAPAASSACSRSSSRKDAGTPSRPAPSRSPPGCSTPWPSARPTFPGSTPTRARFPTSRRRPPGNSASPATPSSMTGAFLPPGPRADRDAAAPAAQQKPDPGSGRVAARLPPAAVLPAEPAARTARRAGRAEIGGCQGIAAAPRPGGGDPGTGSSGLHPHDPAHGRPGRRTRPGHLARTLPGPRRRNRDRLPAAGQPAGLRPCDTLLPGVPRRGRISRPGIIRRALAEGMAPARRLRLPRPPAAPGAPLSRLRQCRPGLPRPVRCPARDVGGRAPPRSVPGRAHPEHRRAVSPRLLRSQA